MQDSIREGLSTSSKLLQQDGSLSRSIKNASRSRLIREEHDAYEGTTHSCDYAIARHPIDVSSSIQLSRVRERTNRSKNLFVEPIGIEPTTSGLQSPRSPS